MYNDEYYKERKTLLIKYTNINLTELEQIEKEYTSNRKLKECCFKTYYENNKLKLKINNNKSKYDSFNINDIISEYISCYNINPLTITKYIDIIHSIRELILNCVEKNNLQINDIILEYNEYYGDYYEDCKTHTYYNIKCFIYETQIEYLKRCFIQLNKEKNSKNKKIENKEKNKLENEIKKLEKQQSETNEKLKKLKMKLKEN